MQPTDYESGSGHVHGLSIQLDDGTWVPLDTVIAEGRRQRAREFRRLARRAVNWVRRTAETFVTLVPARESKRKIPLTVLTTERLVAEDVAVKKREGADQPLAA